MLRTLRAFFQAALLTAQGQQLGTTSPANAQLEQWIQAGQSKIAAVRAVAAVSGYDRVRQKSLKVAIEGRQISMATILGAVAYHLETEYRYLLADVTEHSVTGIYATNLNDQFLVAKLQMADLPAPFLKALAILSEHLAAIPPTKA